MEENSCQYKISFLPTETSCQVEFSLYQISKWLITAHLTTLMYIVVIVGLLLDFAHYQALIDQGMLEAAGTLRDAYAEQCFAPTDLSYLEVL